MKKFIYILILYSSAIFAQNETECPFAAQKYVPYDGMIVSSNNYYPLNYGQLIQNNAAYARTTTHLDAPAVANCFYKTSIHNYDSIKKPFVFVEGISFEKGSINENLYVMGKYFSQDWIPEPPITEQECFASFYSAPQHQGDFVGYSTFNWATLVTGIDAEGYHDGDPLKVEKTPELLNQLCCAGFDICFVDFASGEAYIESNGEALYSILVQLHQQLVNNNSTEKMVVCGASMGGLVARYAINKLEAEGHTDWVENFISFDSPQMGANIPLGVQYTLKHIAGLNSNLKEKYNKLTCPSASQLVNYSCLETNLGSPIVYTTPSPSIERTELLSNPYMGWPQHCKKIAISNGSRLGITQSSFNQPGDKVLDIDGLLDLDIFALPQNDNSYQKVFDFDPPYCMLINPALLITGLATQQSVRVKNTMALDLAPGSFRNDLSVIENTLPDAITGLLGQAQNICSLGWIDNSTNTDKLCFIPIMSSLGAINYETIMKSNSILTQTMLAAAFDGDSKFEDYAHNYSNFDVMYAPTSNQSHVEITDENIGWVMQELTGMDDVIWHENEYLETNTFKARDQIRAGNNMFNNPVCGLPPAVPAGTGLPNSSNFMEQFMHCGDVRIASNHAVFYQAGNFISLENGFYTENDAIFQAEILPTPTCYSNQRTSAPGNQDGSSYGNNSNDYNTRKKNNKNSSELIKNITSQGQNILLFPNPANNYIDINSNGSISSIAVNSVMGATLNTISINQNNYRLTTSDLANGVYLINIKLENETVVKKVVVRHD